MFKRVRKEVVSVAGNRQIPWESSSLTGDFVFNETDTLAQVCADAPRSSEGVFWTCIRNSNDAADFEAYLEHFPDGLYSSLAKSKLANLSTPAAAQDCTDLSGTYRLSTEDTTCEDSLVLVPMDEGRYQGAYTMCHALELVSNIRGIVTIDEDKPNVLSYRWSSLPCSGTTVYSMDETRATGTGRVTKTQGVPGLCIILTNKRIEFKVRRVPTEDS